MTSAAGSTIQVHAAGDCAALSDAWLQAWCRDLVTYQPGSLATQLQHNQHLDQAMIQRIEAGVAWALLHGDDSICDNPLVAAFTSSSPGGATSPSPASSTSPSQRCLEGLSRLRTDAQAHGDSFSMLSPDTQAEVHVGLPGGQPLPTPKAS